MSNNNDVPEILIAKEGDTVGILFAKVIGSLIFLGLNLWGLWICIDLLITLSN